MIRRRYSVAGFLVALLFAGAAEALDSPPIAVGRKHWSFKPVVRPKLPPAAASDWVRNPIDAIVLEQLRAAGSEPAGNAAPAILIRRIFLDLIGLPPSPTDVDRWTGRSEALIEQLLASPHYGERWGRHWLDVARYAETDGFEHDAVRPHSWRYRDYVIESFNAGKPYDEFIAEQVAGDELYPERPRALIATGFNLLGPDMVDSSDQVQRRHLTLNDMTDTTALAFLGLTIGCAKCHDHPFEPLKQRDYYSLQAFYTPVEFRRTQAIQTPIQKRAYDRALASYNASTAVRELRAFDAELRQRLRERSSKFAKTKRISERDLLRNLKGSEKSARSKLLRAAQAVGKPEVPLAMALAYPKGEWRKTHLLHRGDYRQPKEELPPQFPEVARFEGAPRRSRRELAAWLADKRNPLTARVMVNRIWHHHFGRGLVATPSDFGFRGSAPTHPQLLDWLADEFMRRDWDIKAMHRLIMNSATYQVSAQGGEGDPENRYYSRWSPKRMEGEIVRDSLLAISRELNTAMAGRSVFPPLPAELFQGSRGWTANRAREDHVRRSVYIFARRNLRFPFLEVFDAPDSNLSCSSREQSTTAPQSLTMLNDEEVVRAAQRLARRIESAHPESERRVVAAFRHILGRRPQADELAMATDFVDASPISELCRALFNLNDFVYVN